MSESPKVSVGVPVFCGENYLAELLDSILGQTYRDIEVIISDNASTDQTQAICEQYAERDSRIRYYRNETNIGAVRNYNRVFELARGEYFKWTAHDDLYDSTYIERCVDILDHSHDVVLAHSETRMINASGIPLYFDKKINRYIDAVIGEALRGEPSKIAASPHAEKRFFDVLFRAIWCTAVFGVIRTNTLRTTSLHKSYYGSDKVLLSELALMGEFGHVPEPLFAKRQHLNTSHFKDARERAKWIDPIAASTLVTLPLLKGYLNAAIRYGKISLRQRVCCVGTVFLKAAYASIKRGVRTINKTARLNSSSTQVSTASKTTGV